MPFITVKALGEKTVEQKRGLVKDITEAAAKNLGVPAEAVHIEIAALKSTDLAIGGELLSDRGM